MNEFSSCERRLGSVKLDLGQKWPKDDVAAAAQWPYLVLLPNRSSFNAAVVTLVRRLVEPFASALAMWSLCLD